MRIIGGKLKGRSIRTIKGLSVRPMLDQIREALFNILGQTVSGAVVVDGFAGSGGIGLEAISRGAEKAIFFEDNRRVAALLRANIEKCGAKNLTELIVGSLPGTLNKVKEDVDIVFLDPPFGKNIGLKTLEVVSKVNWLKKGGLVIYRGAKEEHSLDSIPPLLKFDERIYGRSRLSFFRKEE